MGELLVFHQTSLVGRLRSLASGRVSFEYDAGWLDMEGSFAISMSLPLATGAREDTAAQAFFANLLPEGSVREAVARQLGLSASNDFAMLEAVGGECAGALTILPVSAPRPNGSAGSYERLEPSAIAEMARRYSVLAEVTGTRGPRLSLAGAQDKLPVRLDDAGEVYLPLSGAPSTHILKVPSRDFKHLPANEVLTTELARALSLRTSHVELLRFGDVEVAVVQRYDRVVADLGETITRLHQEDLCQALGLLHSTKYEQEGGPTFAAVIDLVRRRSTEPLVDTRELIRWIAFVLLSGNADGHGKNLSLLYGPEGRTSRLAPFYDLVCTRAYPRIDRFLAMSIGGERDPGLIGRHHWEALARGVGVGRRLVLREVEEMAETMPTAFDLVSADHAATHGEIPAMQLIREAIRTQCRRSLQLLR
jgi:serine/threonine-protein kinase HipA